MVDVKSTLNLQEYDAGDTINILVDCFDAINPPTTTTDTAVDVNSVTLQLIHESGLIVFTGKAATKYDTGRYRYRWQSGGHHPEGYYLLKSLIDMGVPNLDILSGDFNAVKAERIFYLRGQSNALGIFDGVTVKEKVTVTLT